MTGVFSCTKWLTSGSADLYSSVRVIAGTFNHHRSSRRADDAIDEDTGDEGITFK